MRNLIESRYKKCPKCGLLMLRNSLQSSNLVSAGWEADQDADTGTLEVEFKRGVIYQYTDVPSQVYNDLMFAQSPGRFLLTMIEGSYESQRIA